ncbi:hypothetical protein F8M41_006330 [Gigaspora margarita]|uniref:Uncharacterized protein n=1 Tax=Gigaspora margarita TaxID=4874 RepID=A0A8H4AWT0_GIGMA|nr:hypothetical protein F8M41_006330 [Gigaspora margarita]
MIQEKEETTNMSDVPGLESSILNLIKEADKEIFSSNCGYKNRIEEDKSKASEIGFGINKHEAFGPKSKRMNIRAYTMSVKGERERPDSITVQANIMKKSTKIKLTKEVLDIRTTSRTKNLEYCHQYGIEKDEHEAFKDYKRPTEPVIDHKAEGPEY